MHPILFSLGPLTIFTYGVMLVAAFLLSLKMATHALRRLPEARRPATEDQLVDVMCLALLGGLLGGRVVYVVLQWRLFVASPLEILAIWHGGLVWYGGFGGGVAALGWYARRKRLSAMGLLDFLVPFLALGHAIGRVGCFLNGCCYGKPTTLWCGVRFPGHDEPVLPTQLFEAAALAALFLLLSRLQRSAVAQRRGSLLACYLAGYGAIRFVIEAFRGDQAVVWAGLTLQQVVSVGLVVIGLWMWFRARWGGRTSS